MSSPEEVPARAAATTRPQDRHLPALDAIRGVAAIGIVFIHVAQVFALRGAIVRWAAIGDAGVQIFFVLSGFLIATSVLAKPRLQRSTFLVRRAARIVPLYYLSIVVAVLLVDSSSLFSQDGRADLFAHLWFVHGFAPGMRYSINGVWWTLTVEVCFYLFVAIVGRALARRGVCAGVAIGLVALGPLWRALVFDAVDVDRTTYLIQQFPGQADLFGLGMLGALIIRHPRTLERLGTPVGRWTLLVVSSLLGVAAMAVYYDTRLTFATRSDLTVLWPTVLGVATAAFIGAVLVSGQWLHHVARWSGLAFAGTVSYGVYLFHPFVMLSLAHAWFPQGPLPRPIAYGAASVAGAMVVATIFHYAVERPCMEWGRGLGRLRRHPTQ